MKRNAAKLAAILVLMLLFMVSSNDRAMAITIHYYTNQAAILMYHHFDENEADATISEKHFEQQILYLQDMGYNFISMQQLTAFLENKGDIPANAVVLTFDDGYESTYKNVYPFIREKKIPASFFLIAKRVGAKTGEIPKLTWKEIDEMQASGYDFESHTYDCHQSIISSSIGLKGNALTNSQFLADVRRYENSDEYNKRIYEDLLKAKITLEKSLHKNVNILSPPYGAQNSLVEAAAQKAGYTYLVTTDPGLVDKNSRSAALKRINAGQAGLDGAALHKLIVEYAGTYKR